MTGNLYPKYRTQHLVERSLVGRFLDCLDRAVAGGPPPANVLEIGAGEGEITARLHDRFPRATIVAADLPDPALAREWQGKPWTPLFADATRLPVRDDAFDLVVAVELLEHLVDPGAALAEIARVAAGRVVLSVPREPVWRLGNVVRRRYWSAWGNTPGHLQHWSRREFATTVAAHLQIVDVASPVPWTVVVADARRETVDRPA